MNKTFLLSALLATWVAAGCASHQNKVAGDKPVAIPPETIVMPDLSLMAKVVSVNPVGRFVVLGFPPGALPKLHQILFVYRNGVKVAELKITGPQEGTNIVADLVSGGAQVGDAVRDR